MVFDTILSLAKKFVQVFLYTVMEKPEKPPIIQDILNAFLIIRLYENLGNNDFYYSFELFT